jgi:endonuclease/exonuclease/phosphatase family metal-dependent hydrolase
VLELVREAPSQGGAWTGSNGEFSERDWCVGNPEPPMPTTAIVLGDFNLEPDGLEYQILCGATDDTGMALLTDILALRNPGRKIMSWHSNPSKLGPQECALLDYCLVTEALMARVNACWIDEAAAGSDHQPLWAEFDVSWQAISTARSLPSRNPVVA